MKSSHLIPALVLSALLSPLACASQDLMETYRQAAQSDPELRAANAGLQAARESRPQARSALLPQVSLTAKIAENHSTSAGSFASNGYAINLSQSIYSYKNFATLRATDASIAQSESDYDATAQNLITRVAEAYFNVLAANDNVESVQAEKKAISRQLEQARKQFEVGLIAITDVHEAQAQYDLAVASEITALNEVDSANEALRQITGQKPGVLATLGEELKLSRPVPDDLDDWTQKALQHNPSLIALERAKDAARENIAVGKAEFYPDLSLVGSQTHAWNNGSVSPGSSEDTSLTLQLDVPIFEGFSRDSQVSKAEHDYRSAEENYERQRRAIVRNITDAFRNVGAQITRIKALEQALVSSRSALRATQAGFDVGTRTIVDVLNAQRSVYSAVRDLKRARYDYLLSQLSLRKESGEIHEQDLALINAWLR